MHNTVIWLFVSLYDNLHTHNHTYLFSINTKLNATPLYITQYTLFYTTLTLSYTILTLPHHKLTLLHHTLTHTSLHRIPLCRHRAEIIRVFNDEKLSYLAERFAFAPGATPGAQCNIVYYDATLVICCLYKRGYCPLPPTL